METKIRRYNGKKYRRVPSECMCLGCDLLDEETAECLNPEGCGDCIEESHNGLNHFQFKEIN